MASVVDPLLVTTNYSYDAASRLIAVATPRSSPCRWLIRLHARWSGRGSCRLRAATPQFNITTLAYDGFDRLATTLSKFQRPRGSADDANDNILTRQTRAGPTIAYTYDTLNRLFDQGGPVRNDRHLSLRSTIG